MPQFRALWKQQPHAPSLQHVIYTTTKELFMEINQSQEWMLHRLMDSHVTNA